MGGEEREGGLQVRGEGGDFTGLEGGEEPFLG